ncbi:MAG: hypothetical protein GF331_20125 [Chitinivibrionales bacterium]|nr:hypothetical protein [Chitinivibrionales bacterium]
MMTASFSKRWWSIRLLACAMAAAVFVGRVDGQEPRLPIGLNTMWVNYYGPMLMFNDVATTLGAGPAPMPTATAGCRAWNG